MIGILAFPRSGSTWMRYCVEFLSKKKTGYPGSPNPGDNPISEIINGMGVDTNAPSILYKTHNIKNFGPKQDKLIIIVRDYKEVIPRHLGLDNLMEKFINSTRGMSNPGVDYLKIVEQYDQLESEKLLVYYEDFISKPETELRRVLKFLDVDETHLQSFVENYEFHQKQGIKAYHGRSFTKGTGKSFWQDKIPSNTLNSMTIHLKKTNGPLFEKYLKRYA